MSAVLDTAAMQERAIRASIAVHLPPQDEMTMAVRVELALLRDRATLGLQRCGDMAAGLLSDIVRLTTPAVLAPWPTSRLLKLRFAAWMAMEAARAVELVEQDG